MGDIPRRRMRSVNVAIGVTAVAAAALSGCSSSPDYNAVCVETSSEIRVDDYECDDDDDYGGGYYSWYYINSGRSIPSVGSRVSGGSTARPSGKVNGGGQSSGSYSDSGSSSRDTGGFGGSSGGVSS